MRKLLESSWSYEMNFFDTKSWNQEIVNNLRFKFPRILPAVSDEELLKRYSEWQKMKLIISEESNDFINFMNTGDF